MRLPEDILHMDKHPMDEVFKRLPAYAGFNTAAKDLLARFVSKKLYHLTWKNDEQAAGKLKNAQALIDAGLLTVKTDPDQVRYHLRATWVLLGFYKW